MGQFLTENLFLIISFIFSIIFILLECYIPGIGASGAAGAILAVISVVTTYVKFGFLAALGVLLVIIVISLIAISLSVKSFKTGRLSKSPVVLKESLSSKEELKEASNRQLLVGKKGEAYSDLRPIGVATIENNRIDVTTRGEYIKIGSQIEVISVEDFKVFVKEI